MKKFLMTLRRLSLLLFSICPALIETRLSLYLKTRRKVVLSWPCSQTPRYFIMCVLRSHKTKFISLTLSEKLIIVLPKPKGIPDISHCSTFKSEMFGSTIILSHYPNLNAACCWHLFFQFIF